MTECRVIRRQRARLDIEEATFWYARVAGIRVAQDFMDAVEHAMRHIAAHPHSGSLRYARFHPVGGLRCWPVKGFPYLVFYVSADDVVDVWRVLHGQRDIPQQLQGEAT